MRHSPPVQPITLDTPTTFRSLATAGLRALRNHLHVAPKTNVVVVALGDGVHFLKDGARDAKSPHIDYGPLVSDWAAQAVKFEICELTLTALGLKKDDLVMDAGFTPYGVVRIGRLRGQGYGYIKP